MGPEDTALMVYLRAKGAVYYAKTLELRDVIENWLAYIPHTFPHYTRHTVRHSDEIVRQISKVLFRDDDPEQMSLALTAVEAYILIAAAYLHDAGMVASEREKIDLLRTDEWQAWISDEGGGAKRWNDIQRLRHGEEPTDDFVRNYLADLETRFLLAEFIRRIHHLRAKRVIDQHQSMLGRFAFDDPVLQRTIGDVCVAHGLRPYELEDYERFPDRRDVRGDSISVRLMAILLRLGDLLDMTADRACPLLLNAACPLPANSFAHWTQYQRLTHRLTAPDRIEITAECETQDEHRILQDWCQWMVDEVHAANLLLSRSVRHKGYLLPFAEIEGAERSITIRPSGTANYFPSSWTFELDNEAVFQRLIFNVHERSEVFIRELIQNALDANRCQMYADLIGDSIDPPSFPTQVSEDRRSRYPLEISLRTLDVENPMSGEVERQQVLVVADFGIGMDKDIIQRYFLQVGRSFYLTEEFRRNFGFIPMSRFGVGFLSVFSASDFVTVETFKPSSVRNDGPIRLTITGPRNYLLTERGSRRKEGTEIQVVLRETMKPGQLTKIVSTWCRRVEFPVFVDDLGTRTKLMAESAEDFIYDIEDVTDEDARFIVRAFPINRPGIEGDLYVFARVNKLGEAWDAFSWAQYRYPQTHPQAMVPDFPGNLECLHGISLSGDHGARSGYSARLDYRGDPPPTNLARVGWRATDPRLNDLWAEILTKHLSESRFATVEDGWKYKQRLVDIFAVGTFWDSVPEMIPVFSSGHPQMLSLAEVNTYPTVTIVASISSLMPLRFGRGVTGDIPVERSINPTIVASEDLSTAHWDAIIRHRSPVSVNWLSNEYVGTDWSLRDGESKLFAKESIYSFYLSELPNPETIGCCIKWRSDFSFNTILLQTDHPFVMWVRRLAESAQKSGEVKISQYTTVINLLKQSFDVVGSHHESLQKYVNAWRKLPFSRQDLYPPEIEFSTMMFELTHRQSQT